MLHLPETAFVGVSRDTEDAVAPALGAAAAALAARGLGHLPQATVAFFLPPRGDTSVAAVHVSGTARVALSLPWLARLFDRHPDPEGELAFVLLHEYAHFLVGLVEAAGDRRLRAAIDAAHEAFLLEAAAGRATDAALLLTDHNAIAEEWFCDVFGLWALGRLDGRRAAWVGSLLAAHVQPPQQIKD